MNAISPRRFLALLATAALVPCVLHAAPEKYQVTGPITAMDATTITVIKGGKEKFVMARDASTKMTGGAEPKVGDKVTVQYTITATDVEVKADPKAKAEKKEKPDSTTVTKETKKAVKDVPAAPAPTAMPTPAGAR